MNLQFDDVTVKTIYTVAKDKEEKYHNFFLIIIIMENKWINKFNYDKIEQHKTKKHNKQKQNQNATRELESSH